MSPKIMKRSLCIKNFELIHIQYKGRSLWWYSVNSASSVVRRMIGCLLYVWCITAVTFKIWDRTILFLNIVYYFLVSWLILSVILEYYQYKYQHEVKFTINVILVIRTMQATSWPWHKGKKTASVLYENDKNIVETLKCIRNVSYFYS